MAECISLTTGECVLLSLLLLSCSACKVQLPWIVSKFDLTFFFKYSMYFLFSSYFKYFPICYGPIQKQKFHSKDSDQENTIPVDMSYLVGLNRFKLLGMLVSMIRICNNKL